MTWRVQRTTPRSSKLRTEPLFTRFLDNSLQMAAPELQNGGASARLDHSSVVPLIIDGEDYCSSDPDRHCTLSRGVTFQGADQDICEKILQSSKSAAKGWSESSPRLRRSLLMKLAEV
jgi:hypothetical protein